MRKINVYLTTSLALASLFIAGCGEDNPPTTNTAPVFGEEAYTFTLAENAASGDEIGMVSATDENSDELTYSIATTQTEFAIDDGTGSVTVAEAAALDFESTTSYTLEVQVSDGTDTDTADITVTITDVNESSPEFAFTDNATSYSFSLVADAADGDEVGKISATDADGTAQLTYTLSGEGAGNFAITDGTNVASGEEVAVTVATDADLPSLTSPVKLTVTVSDGDNMNTAEVKIVITSVGTGTNVAPVFASTDYGFNVASDAADGIVVGTVSATDEDEGDLLTYTLSGTEAGSFSIDNTAVASGEEVSITVATHADLSSLSSPVALMVEVSDDTNTAMANVTITIVEANYDADNDGLIDINNLEQLNAMRWDLDGDGVPATTQQTDYDAAFPDAATFATTPTGYELIRSLDFDEDDSYAGLEADHTWSEGQESTSGGWDPIGDFSTNAANNAPFVAVFAGNDYTISNLYINRGSEDHVGLFGHVDAPGTVRDVGLLDVDITGESSVGGLVGVNQNSGTGTLTIENSYATGTVTGDASVGGLVGISQHSSTGTITIRSCYAECTVMGTGNGVGGLVGFNSNNSTGTNLITACYATGNVTGTANSVGGLVGQSDNSSTGTILITACYATGAVTGDRLIGGLVGLNAHLGTGTITIRACYARGNVTGNTSVGGLVGLGATTASYFDYSINSGLTQGDEGKTTDELRMPTGYAGIYADWNVDVDGATGADDPWDFGTASQYPVLKVDFNNDGGTADDVTRQRQ